MIIESELLKQFIHDIKFENRNPQNTEVLQILNDGISNPFLSFLPSEVFYRCRIMEKGRGITLDSDFHGYNADESFIPPPEKTSDMRANYKGIPYLYCANDPYISIVECRPRLGAKVSVATIEVLEHLRLFDTTIQYWPVNAMEDPVKSSLLKDLSRLYSEPISYADDTADYIPTQFIAEYIKNLGYDGIVYQSSLTPEIKQKGRYAYNVVIFNYKKCKAIKSHVYEITYNWIKTNNVDGSSDAPKINEPILM